MFENNIFLVAISLHHTTTYHDHFSLPIYLYGQPYTRKKKKSIPKVGDAYFYFSYDYMTAPDDLFEM